MTPDKGTRGKIVVGIDGSDASLDALNWGARQADLTASTLEVVMTWQWPNSFGWGVPVPDDLNPEDEVRKTLDSALDTVRARYPDLHLDPLVVNGHPAPTLVEESKGADLLVVGSRGHGQFVGMLLGSVSEFCTTNAHCPVLVHRAS